MNAADVVWDVQGSSGVWSGAAAGQGMADRVETLG